MMSGNVTQEPQSAPFAEWRQENRNTYYWLNIFGNVLILTDARGCSESCSGDKRQGGGSLRPFWLMIHYRT